MALKLITPSSALVSLTELKRQVRAADFDDDDSYLESLAAVAQSHIDGPEGWLGRAFGSQAWQLALDCFPVERIALPLPPVQSLTSIKYTDVDGVEQTLSGARLFGVGLASGAGYILPEFEGEWPDTREEPESVRVTFVAGYASTPAPVKHAILLLVGQWYQRRENASEIKLTDMPSGVEALLMPLRHWPS